MLILSVLKNLTKMDRIEWMESTGLERRNPWIAHATDGRPRVYRTFDKYLHRLDR